ncbi:hypothetical protein ACVWWW_001834 [Lysobacter sp. HA18]
MSLGLAGAEVGASARSSLGTWPTALVAHVPIAVASAGSKLKTWAFLNCRYP